MHLPRVSPAEYHRRCAEFDELANFLSLTPADRHFAWVEATEDEDFTEWPVPIDWFTHDPYYVGTDIVVYPQISEFLTDFWDPVNGYNLFVFIAGIGSGKSFSASLSLCYAIYELSCLRHPQRYLSTFPGCQISGDAEIVLMNASAAGANQAARIVYGEAFEKIQKSPYFNIHFEPYSGRAAELEFPNRIRLTPGTSQWQSALGWNVFGFIVDEAAFGIESARADYVAELFKNLNMRRRSRFGDMGFGGLFTSPGSEHGFVELMAGDGEFAGSRIMVRRTTTWEAKGQLRPGERVFLLDRDPDVVRVLEKDLIYVAPGICQIEGTGEEVRYGSGLATVKTPG